MLLIEILFITKKLHHTALRSLCAHFALTLRSMSVLFVLIMSSNHSVIVSSLFAFSLRSVCTQIELRLCSVCAQFALALRSLCQSRELVSCFQDSSTYETKIYKTAQFQLLQKITFAQNIIYRVM